MTAGPWMVHCKKVRVLKRYANRRLYDAGTSKTVTLDDVARFVREGEDIRVVENTTGEDITVRVLGQTFLKITTDEQTVEFGAFLLSALIREVSANMSGFVMRLLQAGIGTSGLTPEKIEKIVEDLVRSGELQLGDQPDFLILVKEQLEKHSHEFKERAREAARQLSGIAPGSLEELSGRLEEMARIIKSFGK